VERFSTQAAKFEMRKIENHEAQRTQLGDIHTELCIM
jgi:hypothetical protein